MNEQENEQTKNIKTNWLTDGQNRQIMDERRIVWINKKKELKSFSECASLNVYYGHAYDGYF